ncbi:MAG: hypothetical protein H6553_03215 [Chitinophagales bacterium]|nr:hypothetical protein [Chitinophagales bacterium]
MKKIKHILILLFVSIFLVSFFQACTKNEDSTPSNSNTNVGFYYGENNTTTLTKADSSWVNGSYNTIIAQNSGSTVVEINLSGLSVGTYNISLINMITYIKGSYWIASSGSVTITKNESNKLSGTFVATAGSGISGVDSLKGEFTDIPIN